MNMQIDKRGEQGAFAFKKQAKHDRKREKQRNEIAKSSIRQPCRLHLQEAFAETCHHGTADAQLHEAIHVVRLLHNHGILLLDNPHHVVQERILKSHGHFFVHRLLHDFRMGDGFSRRCTVGNNQPARPQFDAVPEGSPLSLARKSFRSCPNM